MGNILSIKFIRGPDQTAMTKGRYIYRKVENHPLNQPPYPPGVLSPEQTKDVIDRLDLACFEARSRDLGKIAIRNAVRQEFNTAFRNLANHLEIGAGGDISKLQDVGFDFRKPTKKKGVTVVQDSPAVEATHSPISGTISVRISTVAGAVINELQISSDPNVEENWGKFGQFLPHTNIEVNGRTPGQKYWFRARGIGANEGPWSAPIFLISL